jgi:hypothetical protein
MSRPAPPGSGKSPAFSHPCPACVLAFEGGRIDVQAKGGCTGMQKRGSHEQVTAQARACRGSARRQRMCEVSVSELSKDERS